MFAAKLPSHEGRSSGSESNRTFTDQGLPTPAPLALPHATFAARFCIHRGIHIEEFEQTLLELTLYSTARQLRTLLSIKRDFFAADRAFIASVGRSSNMRELEAVVNDFTDGRTNDGLLRGTFKLRISARKLRRIARQYLQHRRSSDPVAEDSTPTFDVLPDMGPSRSPFPRELKTTAPAAPVGGERPLLSKFESKKGSPGCEISVMQQEIARLTEQRDVLKKAVGIFCEQPTTRDPR